MKLWLLELFAWLLRRVTIQCEDGPGLFKIKFRDSVIISVAAPSITSAIAHSKLVRPLSELLSVVRLK